MTRLALPVFALSLAIVATSAGPAAGAGRIDGSGARLLGERSGKYLCLTLVEPRKDLRLRRCLLGARSGVIRTSYVDETCTFGTRLFGLAPRGTVKINLGGVLKSGKPIVLRRFRVPASTHPARGVAFVVRRYIAGTSPTITAYNADGERIAQRRFGPLPIPACVTLKKPVAG